MAAAQRAAERESARRSREYERISKQQAKVVAANQAAFEVDQFDSLIERITTVHHDCGHSWNWQEIANSAPPLEAPPSAAREQAAQRRLDQYSPGLFDRLFRRVETKRAALSRAVQESRCLDVAANQQAESEFNARHSDWMEMRDLARRIVSGDTAAFRDALDELSPFHELGEFWSRIEVTFRDKVTAEVTVHVRGEAVVPAEAKSLLQSGKLSVKKMPQGRFHEIYQDYVAGAVLRVAREITAVLPVQAVNVTAVANMLDTASGYMTDQPILSAVIPRPTLEHLNFQALDPSDALRNFNHKMDFKSTKGFARIEPLSNGAANPAS